MKQERVLSIAEAAVYLGVSRRTIERRVKAGEISARQSGIDKRERLIAIAELDKLRSGEPVGSERAG